MISERAARGGDGGVIFTRVLHYFHVSHTRAETHLNPFAPTESWILKEWERAEQIIDSLDLSFGRTKIYQDSLPDYSDRGHQAIHNIYPMQTAVPIYERQLELRDSPKDRLLLKLVRMGCQLVTTENIEHAKIIAALWAKMTPDVASLLRDLQPERDRVIAQRINSTLQDGDTGILFLGKDHHVADKLDADIKVHH